MAQRVCVIGAGAAGLCAARHLAANAFKFEVFELSNVLGGTWVYTDKVGKDNRGNPIHSSMYERMRTNLPKEVMAFPDFPFKESEASFLTHAKVQEYLENYCDHFNLRDFIQFETRVESVNVKPCGKWRVQVKSLDTDKVTEKEFDAVAVCNGHYFQPSYPNIVDLDKFVGEQMHSHDYRVPEPFRGKTVAVLGAAASGMDISLEIAETASQVYLCHNNPLIPSKLPSNMVQVRGITQCITPNGFMLTDGSKIQVDVLFYCTGYDFAFPFLGPECNVEIKNRRVMPLYKYFVHADHPTMAFIGLPVQIVPFPLFDFQIRWFLKSLSGEIKLPSSQEMKEFDEKQFQNAIESGIAERHYFKLGNRQWDYNRDLAQDLGEEEGVPKDVIDLYSLTSTKRKTNLTGYKNDSYERDDKGYVLKNRS